jgi:tetratricopeptide (TPR) repeat protein
MPVSTSQRPHERPLIGQFMHGIVPILTGCVMLIAGFLPWLNDPLGEIYTGWQIPVDTGWQLRFNILNYGLLCLGCALLTFFKAFTFWRTERQKRETPTSDLLLIGLCCLMPSLLFYLQYLFVDTYGMDILAQHKIQALLIHEHFTYKFSNDLIRFKPLQPGSSSVLERIEVLIDQLAIGQLLPLLCSWLLISCHFHSPYPPRRLLRPEHRMRWLISMAIALCIVGRAPMATLCDAQAKSQLLAGNYQTANHWLDMAVLLNPAFEQVSYYHIQRGWAQYYLEPNLARPDSLSYLASIYLQQGNLAGAYQEQLIIQQLQKQRPPWSIAQESLVLANLAEMQQQKKGPPIQRLQFDENALPWLRALIEADNTNVYGHYATGLIEYNQHDYSVCIQQMTEVLQLSTNSDIRSWAFTYIGLSTEALGDPIAGRNFLFQAEVLDPLYHNALAREELSGLH